MSDPERSINLGNRFPYDAPDKWWNESYPYSPPPPEDWAHSAARAIIANLQDQQRIKYGFNGIDEEIRIEIVQTLAGIIRYAQESF